MNILMAASECVPFVKVGGLADVVGTLPRYLKAHGHDVRIFIPKYQKVDGLKHKLKILPHRLTIPVGPAFEEVTLREGRAAGNVPVYFIEHPKYFHRPEVYGTSKGDYPDNRERFILFSRAVLEAAKAVMFKPDIIHCHDWQTGIIPAYLKTTHRCDGFYSRTASVYTIHNIAYQGVFPKETMKIAGLPEKEFTWDKLEYFSLFNFMKAGLVYADRLSTVSPTYATEIQLPDGGMTLEGILKSRAAELSGILNGIDLDEWNPAADPGIASWFTAADPFGKQQCKEDLQRTCGLPVRGNTMVFGAVSRLDPQKGYDLVLGCLNELLRYDVQLIILGRGDEAIQNALSVAARRWPEKMRLCTDFNNPLAHKIYAGADAFLMPSRFEPCGLGQMIAMTYGTVPVVSNTGGLADTVTDVQESAATGTGFVFTHQTAADFLRAVGRARRAYADRTLWPRIVRNAMSGDFSWDRAVDGYNELYQAALSRFRI